MTDMTPGQIILLNGTSSSGKTTLATMVQQIRPRPIQLMSLDQFRDGMAGRFRGFNSASGEPGDQGLNIVPIEHDGQLATDVRFGPYGRDVLRGMRRAIAAFARTGNDVIVDDVFLVEDALDDYLEVFEDLDVLFVGVRCNLDVIEERESTRPGRFPGTASTHFHSVHAGCEYDVEVDTATMNRRLCAETVLECEAQYPRVFESLRRARHQVADASHH